MNTGPKVEKASPRFCVSTGDGSKPTAPPKTWPAEKFSSPWNARGILASHREKPIAGMNGETKALRFFPSMTAPSPENLLIFLTSISLWYDIHPWSPSKRLVHQYHYLGYRQIVGQHLKYMAFLGNRPVACIGWGSAAWAVKSRETFIGWDKSTKGRNLSFVVNNTRFLILPWISIKCLASKLLAMNARKIADDWMTVYQQPVYLLETFVKRDRFRGTCYKAANWICVGQTKGTSKRGHDHLVHGLIKDVYIYPLRKDFRKKLLDVNGASVPVR
ncbi:MAG: DUF4338 domain-containing protein [Syntrophales bacterium]|nr:DUF4338 domain-containing protein [Syntrophales bacterium]